MSAEYETVSDDLLVERSMGFGAPLLNARQTAYPFLDKIELHEVILVFLNIAADLLIFMSNSLASLASLSSAFCALSSSNLACEAIYSLIDAILFFRK